ncbi:MAG TPA: hypothetical protein VKU85_00540 [bacterium]|nr:hypothetical protein [bacterium]
MREPVSAAIVALSLTGVLALTAKSGVTLAGNEASRLATVDALVEDRTFAIDGSVFRTVDCVYANGRTYSDKPPLLSLFLALPYAALSGGLGLSFRNPETAAAAVRLVTILGIVPFAVGTALLVRRRLRDRGWGNRAAAALAILSIGSTWLLPYATTVSNHVPAAFLLTAAWIVLTGATCSPRRCAAAGALVGLLLLVDPLSGLGAAAVFAGTLAVRGEGRRLAAFVVPVLSAAAAGAALNVASHGSAIPAYLLPYGRAVATGAFQGSPAGIAAPGIDAEYAWNVTFGSRGLFSHMPALLFGVAAGIRGLHAARIRNGARAAARPAPGGPSALALVLVVGGAYALLTDDYGGWAYGCRYLVPLIPLLFLAACEGLHGLLRGGARRAVVAGWVTLVAVGVLTSAVGAWNPWPVCFEGAATRARLSAGSRGAFLDDHARSPFLVNALCLAVRHGMPGADPLARAALGVRDASDPIARLYLERARRNARGSGAMVAGLDGDASQRPAVGAERSGNP